jgi:GntR family transcriptional repressor for pyruvate dehydrogenase complex
MAQAATRRTFPREIADALRAQILRGQLAPGDLLPPERELALALGTNRNTLREGLRVLESQGLVEARQGQGVRVRDFRAHGELMLFAPYLAVAPPEEQLHMLSDFLRLRSIVAREALVWAAEAASEDALDLLDRRLADMQRAGERRGATLMEPELALYRALVAAGQSLAGTWLFNSLENVIRSFGEAYPGLWLTPPGFVAAWKAILAALRRRDAARAEQLMGKLLDETDRRVIAALGARPRPQRKGHKL